MTTTTTPPDTERVTSATEKSRAQRLVTGAVAFVVPWFLLAMGSPFYTQNWMRLTLGLWFVGLTAGGLLWLGGSRSRQIGGDLAVGVFRGGCLFVLLFALLLVIAPV
jgi:hypothetical protein